MRLTAVSIALILLVSGCGGKDEVRPTPAGETVDTFALKPSPVSATGVIAPQPLVLPLAVPVVEPPLPPPLPKGDYLLRTDGSLLVPPRREARQSGGGGSGGVSGREVNLGVTTTMAAGEWYLFGFEYIAGATDNAEQERFAPAARLLPPDAI